MFMLRAIKGSWRWLLVIFIITMVIQLTMLLFPSNNQQRVARSEFENLLDLLEEKESVQNSLQEVERPTLMLRQAYFVGHEESKRGVLNSGDEGAEYEQTRITEKIAVFEGRHSDRSQKVVEDSETQQANQRTYHTNDEKTHQTEEDEKQQGENDELQYIPKRLLDLLSKETVQLINQRAILRRKHYNHTWVSPSLVARHLLPSSVVEGVKYFLFFIGHGRGGSSILGSLIDAHPHIVVATDYELFRKWQYNPNYHANRTVLYTSLYLRSKIVASEYIRNQARGYSLYIKNAYMGRYSQSISVIGEKEAGSATSIFVNDRKNWYRVFRQLKDAVRIPLKVMQIIRNPYDNIATMTIFFQGGADKRKEVVNEGARVNNSELLDFRIKAYFRNIHAVHSMQQNPSLQIDLHQLHLADLVHDPQNEMIKICKFLGVTCYNWYLETCREHIFSQLSKTRSKVEWSAEQIAKVQEEIDKVPWLRRYTFTSL